MFLFLWLNLIANFSKLWTFADNSFCVVLQVLKVAQKSNVNSIKFSSSVENG